MVNYSSRDAETNLASSSFSLSSSSSSSSPSRLPKRSQGDNNGDVRSHSHYSGETVPLLGKKRPKGLCQARYVLAAVNFLGMTAMASMRQNISVTMLAMVNDSYVDSPHGDNSTRAVATCGTRNSTEDTGGQGEFFWDAHTQELILAAFFYGYIVTQIPGGFLSDKFGFKWVVGIGILTSTVGTLLGPVAARTSTGWYIATRVVSGLGEGVVFPSTLSMWAKWAHPSERGYLNVTAIAGMNMGNIIGSSLGGYLVTLGIAGGWPFPFYVFGSLGLIWFVLWCFLIYNSPAQHPFISMEERDYLEDGLESGKATVLRVPWGSIFASPVVWVLVITGFVNIWGIFILLTNFPLYFGMGLGVPVELAGVLTAFPYALQFVIMLPASSLADKAVEQSIMTKKTARKLMTVAGFLSMALFVALAGVARCNVAAAATLLTIALGLDGTTFAGYIVAVIDTSGPFSGIVFGLVNTASTLGGILGPYMVGELTELQNDIRGWQEVLWIVSGIYLFGAIVYSLFGTVELQPWAMIADDENQNDEYRTLIEGTVVDKYSAQE